MCKTTGFGVRNHVSRRRGGAGGEIFGGRGRATAAFVLRFVKIDFVETYVACIARSLHTVLRAIFIRKKFIYYLPVLKFVFNFAMQNIGLLFVDWLLDALELLFRGCS